MAGKAFGVIKYGIASHLLMGVVASQTTYAIVLRVVTSAVRKPIGLEANVANALHARYHHLRPGAVTRAAEIRHSLGIEPSRIQDVSKILAELFLPDGGNVLPTRTMTTFTGDARNELLDLQA